MSKHTPGPWYVVNMRGWGGLCIGRRPQHEADKTAGDAPIAKVIEKAPHWQEAFPVEANARLIAAAPELLDALKLSRTAMAGYLKDHPHVAPHDCYATGPATGSAVYDLVRCPGCCAESSMTEAVSAIDAAIAKAEG